MANYKIQTLNQISSKGLQRLPSSRYTVGNTVENPDAILVRSHKMHDMQIGETVLAIGRAGAGTNNIPVAELSKRGIPVFNAPGANANAVKELVLAALLMGARNLIPSIRYVSKLDPNAPDLEKQVEDGKKQFAGVELPNRTLGIVGLGAIGSMVADAALKLGMKVIGYDPEITVDGAWRLPSSVTKANRIEDVLRQSDFVTLHVPLIAPTRHLLNKERLALMKPAAILLNFSRDAIVDDHAVVAALREKKLKAYLCDFPSPALLAEPGVVAFPHLGASTDEAEENCAMMVADQVREYLENGTIANAVNFPNVDMPRESPYRLSIANTNTPNMLGQISTALAASELNIRNMLNKSRGDMAYTLVDVDSPIPAAALEKVSSIEGVLAVRVIPAADAS